MTRKDPILRAAFESKVHEIMLLPLRAGKRTKFPGDSRHIHVKSDWVLFWRVKGDTVVFVECGRHDEFFRE